MPNENLGFVKMILRFCKVLPCSNGLSIWYYWALLGFSHKVNELGIFCGDSTILWPNCGMVSFFVKNSSWVIYGI